MWSTSPEPLSDSFDTTLRLSDIYNYKKVESLHSSRCVCLPQIAISLF